MNKLKKFLALLLCAALGVMCLIACSSSAAGSTSVQEEESPDAFELARIINENSHIDITLLGEAGGSADGSSDGQGEMVPNDGYNGEVEAFAFPYPKGSDKVCWTQVYVEKETNDLLGIHVGDDISAIKEIMSRYGYDFSESTDHVYSSKDADHIETYRNGDVYFSFYMKGDTLVYMLVSVHEESSDTDEWE